MLFGIIKMKWTEGGDLICISPIFDLKTTPLYYTYTVQHAL